MRNMYIIALAALIVDQASKAAVRLWLQVGHSFALIPRLLSFTHVRNSGAAFGILAGKNTFFIVASLAVAAALIAYSREVKGNSWLVAAFGLMLGGAAGNLVDRLLFHQVTDFIDFSFFPPTFNIADSALVIGVCLFALDMIFGGKRGNPSGL